MKKTELLQLNGTLRRNAAIDTWMNRHAGKLGAIAHQWLEVIRSFGQKSGSSCTPVAAHVNVGFSQGAALPDPARLLQGTGKFMRHIQAETGRSYRRRSATQAHRNAYLDRKMCIENG